MSSGTQVASPRVVVPRSYGGGSGRPLDSVAEVARWPRTGQEDLVMGEWWEFTVTVVMTMLIGKFLSWGW
jgi:hypothetical protein